MSPSSNVSIASRALFPPLLLAVVMVGVIVLFWTTYRAIEDGNRRSVSAGLAIEQARHFGDALHLGHTGLYRAISLKSQGVEQRIVSEATAAALVSLDEAAHALAALAGSGVVTERALLERTRQAFEAYLLSAREAADFVETEAFVAAMYMNGADRRFHDAQANATAIGAALAAHRGRIDQDAAAALAGAFDRIGIATVLAILLSLAVAVSFARMVTAQARAVAETTAANAKLRLAYGRLEQQSGELTSTAQRLETALVAAEQASRAKSQFLASMSHELRTPLNAILGYAQLFRHNRTLDEWQSVAIDTIERGGDHLLTLISDILDLSKSEAGKLGLAPGVVDLRAFVRDIVNIVRGRAGTKALTFAHAIAADLPPAVVADQQRLRQVLLNLLGNAVKFTDSGRVELRIAVLSRSDAQAVLRFEILDSGVGIAADKLAVAFEPFEQVCDPQRRSGGTGLGLGISQQLVRLMGGEIRVESALGQGSRFWFDLALPVAAADTAPMPVAADVSGYHGPRRRIEQTVAPPQAEIEVLYDLARAGNMRNISGRADHLDALGPQYRAFADELRRMASAYDSKAILAFVQTARGDPAVAAP